MIRRFTLVLTTVLFLAPAAFADHHGSHDEQVPVLPSLALAGAGDTSLATALLGPSAAATATMQGTEKDPRLAALDPDASGVPWGMYFRFSALGVGPLENGTAKATSDSVGVDPGFGLTAALGYTADRLPLSWEIEYMFRQFSYDSFNDPGLGKISGDSVRLHTLALNLMLDTPKLIGPVGIYAGGGVGFRISELSFSSGAGGNESSISGEGLFLQAMAGVTVTIQDNWLIYAGARYTDSGKIGNDTIEVDTAAVGGEIGVRFYF